MSIIYEALTKQGKKTPKPSIISGVEDSAPSSRTPEASRGLMIFLSTLVGLLFIALVGTSSYIAVKWGSQEQTGDVVVLLPSETQTASTQGAMNSEDVGQASLYSELGGAAYRPASGSSSPYFDIVIDESLLGDLPVSASNENAIPITPTAVLPASRVQEQQQRLLEEARTAYVNLEFTLYEAKLEDCIAASPNTPEGLRAQRLLDELQEENTTVTSFEQTTAVYEGEASVARASSVSQGTRLATGDVITARATTTISFTNASVEMETESQMTISRLDRVSNAAGAGEMVSLRVESGSVTALLRPQPQGSSFTLACRHFNATAFSGIFTLSVSSDNTEKISVRSGEVTIRFSNGTQRVLKRGEELFVKNGVILGG